MFKPFKFKGIQYLAIEFGNIYKIISADGDYYGIWSNIRIFKKLSENPERIGPARLNHSEITIEYVQDKVGYVCTFK